MQLGLVLAALQFKLQGAQTGGGAGALHALIGLGLAVGQAQGRLLSVSQGLIIDPRSPSRGGMSRNAAHRRDRARWAGQ